MAGSAMRSANQMSGDNYRDPKLRKVKITGPGKRLKDISAKTFVLAAAHYYSTYS